MCVHQGPQLSIQNCLSALRHFIDKAHTPLQVCLLSKYMAGYRAFVLAVSGENRSGWQACLCIAKLSCMQRSKVRACMAGSTMSSESCVSQSGLIANGVQSVLTSLQTVDCIMHIIECPLIILSIISFYVPHMPICQYANGFWLGSVQSSCCSVML